MSVHMFGLRVRMEATQRAKKGHAPHRTTGVARTSCAQFLAGAETPDSKASPASARTTVAALSGSVHQKRRLKSTSSGFSPYSVLGICGSRAQPHMRQTPETV